MNTSTKMILTAASIAVVASTVMAQSPVARPHVKETATYTFTALAATGTRVADWVRPSRICQDCVLRIEP